MQSRRHWDSKPSPSGLHFRKSALPVAVSKSLSLMSEQVTTIQLSQMVKDDKQVLMSMVHAETNSTHALRQELQHVMEKNHFLVIENCRLRAQMRTQT